jgi:hypothetical protein
MWAEETRGKSVIFRWLFLTVLLGAVEANLHWKPYCIRRRWGGGGVRVVGYTVWKRFRFPDGSMNQVALSQQTE